MLVSGVKAFVGWLYGVAERMVPKAGHSVFISFPDVEDNAFAVYDEMLRAGGCGAGELIWLVKDDRTARATLEAKLGSERSRGARTVTKNSLAGLLCFMRAKRVYFTHGHFWFARPKKGRKKLINLWHGMPLKAIGLLDGKSPVDVQGTEIAVASSQYFRGVMSDAFGIPVNRVLVTGLPRCDQLFCPSERALKFKDTVAQNRKLIVWMPTFRASISGEIREDSVLPRSALRHQFVANVSSLSSLALRANCVVVVKLHPMDFLNQEKLEELPGIVYATNDCEWLSAIGVYGLLALADGLITDVSSVSFDFMATGKPILVTADSFRDYKRELVFDVEGLDGCVMRAESVETAGEFFACVVEGRKFEGAGVERFCEFRQSGSASRFIQALEDAS